MTIRNLGLQLYTLRDDMAKDFEGTLEKVAAAGYKGVEFAGYFGRSAAEVRQILDKNNLTAIGSHVGPAQLQADLQGEIDFVREIGGSWLICPYLPQEMIENEEAWRKTFDLLQTSGAEAHKQGLGFAYHNHAFEFEINIDGAYAFDTLYTVTTPEAVKVEMDVCWVQFAGQDPLAYINRYAGRLPLLHLKDFTKGSENQLVTLELGLGDVNLPAVIEAANQAGVEWFIVEQDNCQKAPLESIVNSINWLKENQLLAQ